MTDSPIVDGFYVIEPVGQVAPVSFSNATGVYDNQLTLSLTTLTVGATICYRLDGEDPSCTLGTCTASTTYSGVPLVLDAPTGGGFVTVRALACTSTGLTNSPVTEETYTFRAAAPTATPTAGAIEAGTEVTFSTATVLAIPHIPKLCFTTDDTAPACTANGAACQHGTEIAGSSGKVTVTEDTMYRVVACHENYEASEERAFSHDVP